MIRRPPRSTQSRSSAASDVYKRQGGMGGTMSERRLGSIGASTGAAFAVLELLAGFIYPQQPRVDGPPAATVAWAHAHRVALQTGMIFGLTAAALLLWFAGSVYSP